MQNETTKDPEIIALLEGRTQASLENIRQFILDLDERDYMDFLYPSDPDFAQELEGRAAETKGMLYERTAISRKPAQLARKELDALRDEDRVSPDLVFRDPYLLDFLGLKDTYSEKDLETAILRDLEHFLLELGSDFSFVARQKRITVDNEDYYLDLLFFHRRLCRLLAVEFKPGRFRAADKGQM